VAPDRYRGDIRPITTLLKLVGGAKASKLATLRSKRSDSELRWTSLSSANRLRRRILLRQSAQRIPWKDSTHDAKLRAVKLGPTDSDEISALADRAIPVVFAKAVPARAAGAVAANVVRVKKREAAAATAMTASEFISGSDNSRLDRDGSAASAAAALAPFPVDKYKANLSMPVINASLLGSQIMYLMDLQDGNGLQFVQCKVTKAKPKKFNDASGVSRVGGFKYVLENKVRRVLLKKVRLLEVDYGIKGKWYRSKKLTDSEK
jgi:hypothetical protein